MPPFPPWGVIPSNKSNRFLSYIHFLLAFDVTNPSQIQHSITWIDTFDSMFSIHIWICMAQQNIRNNTLQQVCHHSSMSNCLSSFFNLDQFISFCKKLIVHCLVHFLFKPSRNIMLHNFAHNITFDDGVDELL